MFDTSVFAVREGRAERERGMGGEGGREKEGGEREIGGGGRERQRDRIQTLKHYFPRIVV